MLEAVVKNLPETAKRMSLTIPYDNAGLIARIREQGKIFSEEYTEDGIKIDGLIDKKLISAVKVYQTA